MRADPSSVEDQDQRNAPQESDVADSRVFATMPAYAWILSLVAGLLSLVATSRGPGLSSDSVTYLSTGINLAQGRGLTTLQGGSLTVFPPGMPLIAAAAEFVGVPPQQVLRWLSAGCAVATVLLGHILLRRLPIRCGVVAGTTCFIAASSSLLAVSKMAWSEPPFLVVTLLLLIILGSVWTHRRITGLQVTAMAVLCWVGFLLRYAGVALVAASALVLFLALRPRSARATLPIMGFGLLASSVPVLWVLRNQSVDGTSLGPRVASTDSISIVLKRISLTFGGWGMPFGTWKGVPDRPLILGGALLTGAVALATWRAFVREMRFSPSGPGLPSTLGPSLLFSAVYVAYLAAAQLTTALDAIGNRLLSPVFVPFILVCAVAVNQVLSSTNNNNNAGVGRLRPIVVGVIVVLIALGQVAPSVRQVRAGVIAGIDWNSRSWRESALAVVTVSELERAERTLYTNQVPALWAATGLQTMSDVPRFAGVRGIEVSGALDTFGSAIACDDAVLLAMYDKGDPRTFTLEELSTVADLKVVAETTDGVLYEAAPLQPSKSHC